MEIQITLMSSRLTKVSGNREMEFSGKISMNQNIKIKSMEKFKPTNSKIESIKADYSFEIDYGELGKVEIEGILFLGTDSKTTKKILEEYKNKNFQSAEQIKIMNMIIQKASIRAFEIEEELGLPIHIRLPELAPKQ
ncbi:hypothetical protein CMI41_02920 [Candidatus Pacearchaeota archaeon]|nr:hypothetical protein [Candidatus Pacearchaeota archaeon]|tara:strand:+ start:5064 stop:5474 length:411 start_codon:yes stop_codon:yes gene_type:complete